MNIQHAANDVGTPSAPFTPLDTRTSALRNDDELRHLDVHAPQSNKSTQYALLNRHSHLNLEGKVSEIKLKSQSGYSDVFIGLYVENGKEYKVAVKKFRAHVLEDRKLQRMLSKELGIWSRLSHPRILSLEGFYIAENGYPCLVSLWMENGTVMKYLEKNPSADILPLATGIAEGIQYLHSNGIVHSDIKPDNILISDIGRPLLCDFGISRMLAASETFSITTTLSGSLRGTVRYMSKEILQPTDDELSVYTKEADVWAFGMTVFALLAKHPPFSNITSDVRVIVAILDGKLPSWPEDIETRPFIPRILQRMCDLCWKETLTRPSISAIASELQLVGRTFRGVSSQLHLIDPMYFLQFFGENLAKRGYSTQRDRNGNAPSVENDRKINITRRIGMQLGIPLLQKNKQTSPTVKPTQQAKKTPGPELLILGGRESGKSTIVKQLKKYCGNGFTQEELSASRPIIYQNLLMSAQHIVLAMRKLAIDPIIPANHAHADMILNYKIDALPMISSRMSVESRSSVISPASEFSEEVALAIDALWNDPIMPKLMDHINELNLMDSAQYFLNDPLRIGSIGYIPTEVDFLHAWHSPTGVEETMFSMGKGRGVLRVVEINWMRNNLDMWLQNFRNDAAIIYCVDMTDYDRVLVEDSEHTRMTEGLELFESFANSEWLKGMKILLFFSKMDAFEKKLAKVPLEKYFPDYTHGVDVEKAAEYIMDRFAMLRPHRTTCYISDKGALDASIGRNIFNTLSDLFISNGLNASGFM